MFIDTGRPKPCCCCCCCCTAGEGDVYRLPEHMREAVEAQYRRDVARVHGGEAGRFDDEYNDFIKVRWGVCEQICTRRVPRG